MYRIPKQGDQSAPDSTSDSIEEHDAVVENTTEIQPLLLTAAAGLVAGAVAKLADVIHISYRLGLNDLASLWGLWVVVVTLIAAWSRTQKTAITRTMTFLLAMVTAYYAATWLFLGIAAWLHYVGWLLVALVLAPPFSFAVWQSRHSGWQAAFGAALPIGLLLWETYSLRFRIMNHLTQVVFDVVAVVVLFVVLPRDRTQRLRTVPAALVAAGIAWLGFNRVLPMVLGVLRRG